MYLHCPEDLQVIVMATMEEAEMRRWHFISMWAAFANQKLDNA